MGMRSSGLGLLGRSSPGGRSGVSVELREGLEVRRVEMFPGERTSVRRASAMSTGSASAIRRIFDPQWEPKLV